MRAARWLSSRVRAAADGLYLWFRHVSSLMGRPERPRGDMPQSQLNLGKWLQGLAPFSRYISRGKDMTNGVKAGRLLLVFATTLGGCDSANLPSAPSTIQQPAATVAPGPPVASWPPGPFTADVTLTGVVFEVTPTGPLPIEGVVVYCELCREETHS